MTGQKGDDATGRAHDTGAGRARDTDASRRGRGRPRAGGARTTSARAAIVDAAAAEFAERGYDAVSLRAIARHAGVDPALIHHYFADKADLFAETIAAPFRPDRAVEAILAGPSEAYGAAIVRYLLTELEQPRMRKRAIAILRTAVANNPGGRLFTQFLIREVLKRIVAAIDEDDADLRAAAVASQIIGMLVVRFVIGLEPLASASIEEVVERIGPVIQWHLRGGSGPGPSLDFRLGQPDNSSHDE